MSDHTELLVIGAGPYAYAAAAYAIDRGIRTHIVGIPMAFWREQMPTDMYLRSGPDWHLDVAGEDTFAAYFEDRGLCPADFDPIPISVFLDHTDWFAERKKLKVDARLVNTLTKRDETFVATMEDGSLITADRVLAAPGVRHFVNLPDWYDDLPPGRRSHTSELVSFDDLAGARVVIIGGRQSAYEWAALLCDHGAERVDVVHRHATPTFAKVSWAFVDPYVEQTVAHRGWWRGLTPEEQTRIAQEFWQVGRLTLEHWLVPRLLPDVVTSHPQCHVAAVMGPAAGRSTDSRDAEVRLTLSDGSSLTADHVVFASGYRADLARVPYLSGVDGRDLGDERLPRPVRGVRDLAAGPLDHRLRFDARLRTLLRLHQGLPVGGPDRRGRDARLTTESLCWWLAFDTAGTKRRPAKEGVSGGALVARDRHPCRRPCARRRLPCFRQFGKYWHFRQTYLRRAYYPSRSLVPPGRTNRRHSQLDGNRRPSMTYDAVATSAMVVSRRGAVP